MKRSPSVSTVMGKVAKAAGERANQSALFRWMLEHHVAFASGLPTGQPGWRGIAEVLTASGFSKPDGSAVTAAYVRHTWWKVRRRLRLGKVSTPVPAQPRTVPQPHPVPTVVSARPKRFEFPE